MNINEPIDMTEAEDGVPCISQAEESVSLGQTEAAILFQWLLSNRAQWLGESTWLVTHRASISLGVPIAPKAVRQMRNAILECVSTHS